jgi:hypothetical protein
MTPNFSPYWPGCLVIVSKHTVKERSIMIPECILHGRPIIPCFIHGLSPSFLRGSFPAAAYQSALVNGG